MIELNNVHVVESPKKLATEVLLNKSTVASIVRNNDD